MSNAKDRKRRERKAYERGRADRRSKVPQDQNPLRLSARGIGNEWDLGWRAEDEEILKARLAARRAERNY